MLVAVPINTRPWFHFGPKNFDSRGETVNSFTWWNNEWGLLAQLSRNGDSMTLGGESAKITIFDVLDNKSGRQGVLIRVRKTSIAKPTILLKILKFYFEV